MRREGRIKVEVGEGVFASERSASFDAYGKHYSLIVDEQDIKPGDYLAVHIVAESEHDALIDLPRETFTSGSRVRVPRALVQPVDEPVPAGHRA